MAFIRSLHMIFMTLLVSPFLVPIIHPNMLRMRNLLVSISFTQTKGRVRKVM